MNYPSLFTESDDPTTSPSPSPSTFSTSDSESNFDHANRDESRVFESLSKLKAFVLESIVDDRPEFHAKYKSSQTIEFVIEALKAIGVRTSYWTEGSTFHLRMTQGPAHGRMAEGVSDAFRRVLEGLEGDEADHLRAIGEPVAYNKANGEGAGHGGFDWRTDGGDYEIMLRVEIAAFQWGQSLANKIKFWGTTTLMWLLIIQVNYNKLHEDPLLSLTWYTRHSLSEDLLPHLTIPTTLWTPNTIPYLSIPLSQILHSYNKPCSSRDKSVNLGHARLTEKWHDTVKLEVTRKLSTLERRNIESEKVKSVKRGKGKKSKEPEKKAKEGESRVKVD